MRYVRYPFFVCTRFLITVRQVSSSYPNSSNLPKQEDRSRFVTEMAKEMFEKLHGAKAKFWWAIVKGVGPGVYSGTW